jgi:retinol dehydrogenase-12
VNYLSTALLSLLLLPRMVQTGQAHSTHPHLVVVTSESHLVATFDMRLLDAPSIFEKMSDRTYFTRRKVVSCFARPASH